MTGHDNRIHRNTHNGLAWSGWSPLPGNAQTRRAPSAVVYGSRIWLLIRSDLGDIYRNRYNGSSWSGWAEVPGNGSTPSAATAAVFGKRLWIFVRGTDNGIYFNSFRS